MGTPLSAADGKLAVDGQEVADIRAITLDRAAETDEYASTATNGRKRRLGGHADCTGTFEMYAEAGSFSLGFDVGDTVTITGYADATHSFSLQAVVSHIAHGVPVEAGRLVPVTVSFGGDGEPTLT